LRAIAIATLERAGATPHPESMSDPFAMHPGANPPAAAQKPAVEQMNYQQLDAPLLFTSAAARKVAELIREEGNAALKLRVYISGGGCSGFQYGFSFDEEQAEDDLAVQKDGVTLLVDPLSLQYLMGAEVDYSESLHGAQFSIRNPNAKTTCGCGSSFSA
jgi:iron-sulfur cluster insertion protein